MKVPMPLERTLAEQSLNPPQGIAQVLNNLVFKLVDNPINAILSGNYIGILVWGVALGLALRHSADATKRTFSDLAEVGNCFT